MTLTGYKPSLFVHGSFKIVIFVQETRATKTMLYHIGIIAYGTLKAID